MSGQVAARLGRLFSRRLLSQTTKPTQIRVQAIRQISAKIHLYSHYTKNAFHIQSGVLSDKCLISGNPHILIKIVLSHTLGCKRKREFHTTSKRCYLDNNPVYIRINQLGDSLRDVFSTARVSRNPARFATEECKNLIRQFHTELAVTTPFSRQISDRPRLQHIWCPESLKEVTNFVASNIEAERDNLLARDSPEVKQVEYYIKQLQDCNPELQDHFFHVHIWDSELPTSDDVFSMCVDKSGYIFMSKHVMDPTYRNEDTLVNVIAREMGHCVLQLPAEDAISREFFAKSVKNSAIAIQQSCDEDVNSKKPVKYVEEIVATVATLIPNLSDKGRFVFEADAASAYFCHNTKYNPKEQIKWMQERGARSMLYDNVTNAITKVVYDTMDDVTGVSEDVKRYINHLDPEMVHPPWKKRAEALEIYYAKLLKKDEPCTVS